MSYRDLALKFPRYMKQPFLFMHDSSNEVNRVSSYITY